jgi:hypothetical protein
VLSNGILIVKLCGCRFLYSVLVEQEAFTIGQLKGAFCAQDGARLHQYEDGNFGRATACKGKRCALSHAWASLPFDVYMDMPMDLTYIRV